MPSLLQFAVKRNQDFTYVYVIIINNITIVTCSILNNINFTSDDNFIFKIT
jgi:hypothetical protein